MSALQRLEKHQCQRPPVKHFWGHYRWVCPDCRCGWERQWGFWTRYGSNKSWVTERWQS